MANFPLPKGYQRMGAYPLDATEVFASLALLEAYASTNGTAYAGQVCSVNDGSTVTVYKINVDKSVSLVSPTITPVIDYGTF